MCSDMLSPELMLRDLFVLKLVSCELLAREAVANRRGEWLPGSGVRSMSRNGVPTEETVAVGVAPFLVVMLDGDGVPSPSSFRAYIPLGPGEWGRSTETCDERGSDFCSHTKSPDSRLIGEYCLWSREPG